ncbi:hypothetical protein WHZ78_07795 [Bradyrhizobium symbiodeficiens]|uniref:hypothetical protein n=1 Tax=Bradyrhizobium symbiodeficiens TaxID=1404367 RepID=UPI0030D0B573
MNLPPVGVRTSRVKSIPLPTQFAIKAVLSRREYVFADEVPNAAFGQAQIGREISR